MKLYSTLGYSSVTSEEYGQIDVNPVDGSVEVPESLGHDLHKRHVAGVLAWEDEAEHSARLIAEHEAHRRDPMTLLDAVEKLQAAEAARVPSTRKAAAK